MHRPESSAVTAVVSTEPDPASLTPDAVVAPEATTPSAESDDPVLARALAQPYAFHLHQLLTLFEHHASGQRLRIRPSDGLSFPAADVRRAKRTAEGGFEVEVTLGGFYGVDAPLPQYFLEDATFETEHAKRLKAFLDIFNQRAYELRHAAWKKHRLVNGRASGRLYQRLASACTGQRLHDERPDSSRPYSERPRNRSASALAATLRSALGLPHLAVDKTRIRWCSVDNPLQLNGGQSLGHSTLVGNRVPVLGRTIRIHTGPVDRDKANQLMPDQPLGQTLSELTAAFLPAGTAFDVELQMPPESSVALIPGHPDTQLGRPLCLGQSREKPEPIRRVLDGAQYLHAAFGERSTA
ncbi:MAG: type VI secretion system baseplate subunit TssG [Saccharospirillum sp.]|nr:type VI secretion system baseplate subunit TssG [Saccharospirillum sp.]